MQPGVYSTTRLAAPVLSSVLVPFVFSAPYLTKRTLDNVPLIFDWGPAPSPADGPPGAADALRDPAYLPAQIGGIIASYALSLLAVAGLLIAFSRKRRERIRAAQGGANELAWRYASPQHFPRELDYPVSQDDLPYSLETARSPVKNFSYPAPLEKGDVTPCPSPPQSKTSLVLGANPQVDQNVVSADREMAQQQLEEMYKHVMEQEDAKEAGVVLEEPPAPIQKTVSTATLQTSSGDKHGMLKKGKGKPANLDLDQPETQKQSRAASFISALKSPRRKQSAKGLRISSPILTPLSETFPRQEGQEMDAIPPRHYAPASPPPVPIDQDPYLGRMQSRGLSPLYVSPQSTMSIDETLEGQLGKTGHSRIPSFAPTEYHPTSAASESSTTPLVCVPSSPTRINTRHPPLPSSPKPGQGFKRDTLALPSSPRPGASFSRPNAPSAVRTGGALPLRAYEPAMGSPSVQHTKQTTFERSTLAPSGMRTPFTAGAVPYSPYQPHTPVMPMTPSLITKKDRKRMRQMQPKTPTTEMVQSSDDLW